MLKTYYSLLSYDVTCHVHMQMSWTDGCKVIMLGLLSSALQVNYDEKHAKGKEDASDYSAQSDDEYAEDSGGEEDASFDKPALKARAPALASLSNVHQALIVSLRPAWHIGHMD